MISSNKTYLQLLFLWVMLPIYLVISFSVGHIGRGGILNCMLTVGAVVIGARMIHLYQRLEVERIAKNVAEKQGCNVVQDKVCVCGHTQAYHSPCSPMGCEAPGCDCHRTVIEQRRA